MNTEATLAAEPTVTETTEAEVKATETVEVVPEPTPETAEAKEEKRQAKIEKRFSQLTKRAYAAEARAEALERMYAQQKPQEPNAKADGELDVDEIVERKLAEREQQKHFETVEQKKEGIFSKLEKAGDFDRDDFLESVRVTPVMAEAILDSDLGDKVVKHLYSNPEEAERIASLPLARQAVEIGKLEVKLSSPAPVKKSGAPAPITPIAAKAPSSNEYRDDMTDAEYAKWRRENSKRK